MTNIDTPKVDLSNCDREPIHIPGAILPHGAMLVVSPATWTIEQTAGDCEGLLGRPSLALAGHSLRELFSPAQIAQLSDLIEGSALVKPRHLLDPLLRAR